MTLISYPLGALVTVAMWSKFEDNRAHGFGVKIISFINEYWKMKNMIGAWGNDDDNDDDDDDDKDGDDENQNIIFWISGSYFVDENWHTA